MAIGLFAILLGTLVIPALGSRPRHPLPLCSTCLSAKVFDAPGIGFDLTHAYGTSAAHLVNGSILDVAYVPAPEDYISLVARFLDAPPPDRLTSFEKWQRYLNKKLGLPATPEVGIIGRHLITLRDRTVSALGVPLDYVVVTHPPLTGLRRQDLTDALEYGGMRSWLDYKLEELKGGIYPTVMGEAHAAFAANGMGLCHTYRNLFSCWSEEEELPNRVVLAVSFTRHALFVSGGIIRSPFTWSKPPLEENTNMQLGLNSLDTEYSPKEFWAAMGVNVVDMAQKSLASAPGSHVGELLLIGENATHPEFLSSLGQSLSGFGWRRNSSNNTLDPIFVGARGAALYARWRQEAPLGCREWRDCEDQRDKERARSTSWNHSFGEL